MNLLHPGESEAAQETPWVCPGMGLSCSAKLVAHGRTALTNRLAGSSLICVHRVQRGRERERVRHLWEHAAEVHFAICHNFVIGFRRGRKQHVSTSGRPGKRDNKARNYPR